MSSLMDRLQNQIHKKDGQKTTTKTQGKAKTPMERLHRGVADSTARAKTSRAESANRRNSASAERRSSSQGKHPHHNSASIKGNNSGPTIGKGNPEAYNLRKNRNQATGLYKRINGESTAPAATTAQRLSQGNTPQQSVSQSTTPKSTTERLSQGEATKVTNPMASLGAELRNVGKNTSESVPETPRESNVPLVNDTVELQTTDIQDTSSGWGSTMWTFTGFAGVGVALAGLYYWFQRRFGGAGSGRKRERKLRQWELVRMVSTANDAFMDHSAYRPSYDHAADSIEEGLKPSMLRMHSRSNASNKSDVRATLSPKKPNCVRQSSGGYIEVPRMSYEPSMWERYSKGSHFD